MLCGKVKLTIRLLDQMQKSFACRISSAPKDFNEIPSGRELPLIGTTLPLLLAGSSPKLHYYIDNRHKQFGRIFKEKIGPVSCVFISDVKGMRSVFAHEGKYPMHVLPEAWAEYNSTYNYSRGIFFMNGEEWLYFRKIMNLILLRGDTTYIDEACTTVADIMVNRIRTGFVDKEFQNLEDELYKWTLDVIMAVLLGAEVYQKARVNIEKDVKYLASIVHLIFQRTVKLQLIPASLAAKYRISHWKKFEKAVDEALNKANSLIDDLITNYPNGNGLLHRMKESNLTRFDISRIVTDLVLAAGDTTSYSMEWLLYLIAKNIDVQERLRNELHKKDTTLEKNIYLKNVIRESIRLYPIAPFLTRFLAEEAVISDYKIPAGTLMILSIFTSGRDPEYVKNPEEFLPCRWDRSDPSSRIVKLASLPFAIGARSCLGKKIAETQLQMTLAKLVENFDIELLNRNDKVDVILKMVSVPSKPIRLKFTAI